METQVLPASDPNALQQALALIRQGRPVAFPTDTVYGLGCLATDAAGIDRLYEIKEREAAKAIAVLLSSSEQLPQVAAGLGEMAGRFARRFWPGPLTLVVYRSEALPDNISQAQVNGKPTIGLRMPDHPVALTLIQAAGPLAVTSANLSGEPSTTTAEEVLDQLGGRIALVLDGGRTPGGASSTVVDCTGQRPVILRPGPVSEADLLAALKQ